MSLTMWIYIIVAVLVIGGLVWWLTSRGKKSSGSNEPPSTPGDMGQQPPVPPQV